MIERDLPSAEAYALLELTRELAQRELAPRAADFERSATFPREIITTLGQAGLLSLPYPARWGGGDVPYAVYLQVLEELAHEWLTVALTVSVHTLACFPLVQYGTSEQRDRWLPSMLNGEHLGAYCLSEPHAGSDAANLTTRAARTNGHYVINGVKAWVTHAGVANFYTVMVRTGHTGSDRISCLLVPAETPGVLPQHPEHKMGMAASPTAQVAFDEAHVAADRLISAEGDGFPIAMAALDAGRLGIAACAVGLAQAALDYAVTYANQRRQFARPIIQFQGVSFLLADCATQIAAARALYLAAAALKDAGKPYRVAAAKAKVFCTDTAMRVTTDAIQVLGGAGYVEDHPVERWMREAKVLQIVEGTNQIQRLVIARELTAEK